MKLATTDPYISVSEAARQLGWPVPTCVKLAAQEPPLGFKPTPKMRLLSPADVNELRARLAEIKPNLYGRHPRKNSA